MSDAAWKIPRPRDYMKIKYAGDCKCGDCQLVPAEMLMVWDAQLATFEAQARTKAEKS